MIYLVRHGATNPDKTLSAQGIEETINVAKSLAPLEIDEIIHSTKARARQTAELLEKHLAPDVTLIEREGLEPGDPIEPLLADINAFDRHVMIVGHLPFLPQLLRSLVMDTSVVFENSTVVCLEKQDSHWSLKWVQGPSTIK